MGLKVFPHFQEALWQSLEEEHHLSDPIFLLFPMLAPHPCQEEGPQMEGRSDFHTALKFLQNVNHARGQLECALAQEPH